MKTKRFVFSIILAWVALTLVHYIIGMIAPLKTDVHGGALTWSICANLLVTVVLAFAAVRSGWKGYRLGLALFAAIFGVAAINLIEAAVFLTNTGMNWLSDLAQTLVVYALVSALWTVMYERIVPAPLAQESSFVQALPRTLFFRFAACSAVYLILYIAAGMIIYPYVRDYYATQRIPSFGEMILLQLLVRGPAFTAICILLIRMLRVEGLLGAVCVGAAFTILTAVAPLLPPNPVFPDSVRWVHMGEAGTSNFLFGSFVFWMMHPRRKTVMAAHPAV